MNGELIFNELSSSFRGRCGKLATSDAQNSQIRPSSSQRMHGLAFLGVRPILTGQQSMFDLINKAAIMAQRKKRPAVRKRKSITRRKVRKPSKSARKRAAKRGAARVTSHKPLAKAKLKRGAKKARKRMKVAPAAETGTEIEATEVREVSGAPEQPEESRSAPPESEGQ